MQDEGAMASDQHGVQGGAGSAGEVPPANQRARAGSAGRGAALT
jgi:hypothetical protein